jgi:hypothetical protein
VEYFVFDLPNDPLVILGELEWEAVGEVREEIPAKVAFAGFASVMILDARDATDVASVRGILSSFIRYTAFMCVVLVFILGIVHPFRLED